MIGRYGDQYGENSGRVSDKAEVDVDALARKFSSLTDPSEGRSEHFRSDTLSDIRYESGTTEGGREERRRTNACAQVSCPNTLRPDRRSRDDEDDEGTHIERASERVGCDRKGR